jgi:hypothetical protein
VIPLLFGRTLPAQGRSDEGGKPGRLADFVQAISHREDWSSRIEKSEDIVAGWVRIVGSHGSGMVRFYSSSLWCRPWARPLMPLSPKDFTAKMKLIGFGL